MGQCCNAPSREHHLTSKSDGAKSKKSSSKSDVLKGQKSSEHHPLHENQSSGSQSTPKANNYDKHEDEPCAHIKFSEHEYEESEETLDLSAFQEDVIEFIEFWHLHYGSLQKDYIYTALVKRIHNKVKEQYPKFPKETIEEFITTLPDVLEALEVLVNMAIDGDIDDAVSLYKQYQPIFGGTGDRSTVYTGSGQLSPMPIPERDKKGKGRHKQQDSFSIKLTPAYIIDDETSAHVSKLPVPRTPSRSRTRSRSRSKSKSKSARGHSNDIILTDKDGIDLDLDDMTSDMKRPQIVVTKPMDNDMDPIPRQLSTDTNPSKYRHRGNSLVVSMDDDKDSRGNASPSPDLVADEDAYNLFMGTLPSQHHCQHSFEEVPHAKMIQHSRTHSTVEERDSDMDDPSVPLKESTDDIVVDMREIDKERTTESYGFDIETAEDAEIVMVGIMRTLWFDRTAKYVTKCGLYEEIDDLFFLLSNALETAIGTFREYKQMMETFSLYTRQGLRTTLELIRAIINDLPLITVNERTEEIYDDPYSILIHFADRCDVAVEFWNEHISSLQYDVKQQLSMRVYSYAVMYVPATTYERLKQKGSMVRWSTLLLDFMESIIRFFSRNRHQDLMEYLLIIATHHEKMQIPSTLLGNMGEWLDEVFATHFDEEIYSIECSDAIQFVYAFVGEVISGAYDNVVYDTQSAAEHHNVDSADQINEHISSTTAQSLQVNHSHGLSTEIQFPISFKSVVQLPDDPGVYDDELTLGTHYHTQSDITLQKPYSMTPGGFGHFPQSSLSTFHPRKFTGNTSLSFGPRIASVPATFTNLDLDAHPCLTDIIRVGPFSGIPQVEPALAEKYTQENVISLSDTDGGPLSDMKRNSLVVNVNTNALTLKPPGGSIYIGNSPLSRLESLTPQGYEPRLTPNGQSFDEAESTPGTVSGDEDRDHDAQDGERSKTLHTALNAENEHKKPGPLIPKHAHTLNVMFKDELEKDTDKQMAKRASKRAKKRSFSSVDNNVIKYLAPNSQNNYTKSKSIRKKDYRTQYRHRKHSSISQSQSKTSSQMLLGKQHEKHWKPMHFLQKIMDLEGRKIISNYAFAPSDGSMSSKIVDLSIFHQYFETAQQFWSRFIDVNDRMRNKISDDLFNVFSQRINDSVRSKIMVLFAQKQINFVQMFCIYFNVVHQYLEKCKVIAVPNATQSINPALLNASKIPSVMTPSLRNKPHSGNSNRYVPHKRTFSQRSSMSIGLSKFKYRSETTRDPILKTNQHFHSAGQFFVREMLRMGTKHRSHSIAEKTLKLVAKCLIEVIEKHFEKTFNDKTKRAFTIALKLCIKFMCVEAGKKKSRSENSHTRGTKQQKQKPKIKSKSKQKPQKTPPPPVCPVSSQKRKEPTAFRTQSAQVYSVGFVD